MSSTHRLPRPLQLDYFVGASKAPGERGCAIRPGVLVSLHSFPSRSRGLLRRLPDAQQPCGVVPSASIDLWQGAVPQPALVFKPGGDGFQQALEGHGLQLLGHHPHDGHAGDPGHGLPLCWGGGCRNHSCDLHALLLFDGDRNPGRHPLWHREAFLAEVSEAFPLLPLPPKGRGRKLRAAAQDGAAEARLPLYDFRGL